MTVSRRLLVPVMVLFGVVLIALVTGLALDRTAAMHSVEEKELRALYDTFHLRMEAMRDLALGLATQSANDPTIANAFAEQDRLRLAELTTDSFQAIQESYNVSEYQFHEPHAASFLRVNQPDQFGDDLATYRFTVLEANLERNPVAGLEIGRNGLAMHGVVPVQAAGDHIGTVEYGLLVDQNTLDELKSTTGADWTILLSHGPASVALTSGFEGWQLGPTDELVLLGTTLDRPVYAPGDTYDQVIDRGRSAISRVRDQDRDYALYSAPLLDYRDDVIGVVQVASDRAKIVAVQEQQVMMGVAAFLAAFTLGGVGLYLIVTRALRPITSLTETATAIAGGDLARTAPVTGRGELGNLARAFNTVKDQLRSVLENVDRRVTEHTDELEQANAHLTSRAAELERSNQNLLALHQQLEATVEQSQRRAATLRAVNEVMGAITQLREQDALLLEATELISQHFGYYHVGIFLLDEVGRHAVLAAANSRGGQRMLARGHRLEVGAEGIIGHVTKTGLPRISLDVGEDAVYFDNPDLPDTRSELAVPLRFGEAIIGALDVQSMQEEAFGNEDVAALAALSDQIAVTIWNARLYEQTQQSVLRAEQAQRRQIEEAWSMYTRQQGAPAFEYTLSGVAPAGEVPLPEIDLALQQGELVTLADPGNALAPASLAVPIKFRGQVLGALGLHAAEADREWSEDELLLVQDVAEQVGMALENIRLFQVTERRARREALVSQIVTKVRQSSDVDGILQTAVRELGVALGSSRTYIHLTGTDDNEPVQEVNHDGNQN